MMIENLKDYGFEPKLVEEPCLVCQNEGRKAEKVFFHGIGSTLVGYGSHDDNCRTGSYTCSNGHFYGVRYRNVCRKCGWKGKVDCSVCGPLGVKVVDPDTRRVLKFIPIEIELETEHEE